MVRIDDFKTLAKAIEFVNYYIDSEENCKYLIFKKVPVSMHENKTVKNNINF